MPRAKWGFACCEGLTTEGTEEHRVNLEQLRNVDSVDCAISIRTMTKLGVPTLLGIPFDANSSYLRGPGDAPLEIRKALHCEAYNQWTELGVDLGATGAYEDAGDLKLADNDAF